MTPDEASKIRAQAQALLDRIADAHTPENLARLQAEFAERGWKLTGSLKRRTSFALADPNGVKLSGLSLASVEDLLEKADSQ